MNQGVTRNIRCRKLGFDTENARTKTIIINVLVEEIVIFMNFWSLKAL